MALSAIVPNPSRRHLDAVISLPDRSAATLELFDLSGRRLRVVEVGALGPGQHRVRMTEGLRLSSGIYFARLKQGRNDRSARAVVLD